MAVLDVAPFDVCGPLPRPGVTVLEASAGTGKTYTIAALAARYVAEGVPLDQLLLVTFTRMATGELRERVRERLVSAEAGVAAALAGALPAQDGVVRLLCEGPREAVEARRDRLARAVAGFDAATIATTHGFCQEVLDGLGVAGDVERDSTFVEDVRDLVEEVVDDLYVRRFSRRRSDPPTRPPFDRTEALRVVRAAVEQPDTPLAAPPEGHAAAGMRVRLAEVARAELEARKQRLGVMTYDDLLTRLQATLHGPGGEAAAERLRRRHRVVLVDEFQDTDPVQWDVLQRAFGGGEATLVLIGDPKQAIYAFRGADVHAYLAAARSAGARATLAVNRRSDQALLDAYDVLFGGAQLGHPEIVYRPVAAAAGHEARGLRGRGELAPLRVRLVRRDDPALEQTRTGFLQVDSARGRVAEDLAAVVVRLLDAGTEVRCGPEDWQAARPRHLAALVRSNRTAALVRDALEAAGVPAVINGAGSVMGTPAATEWLQLLEALERPSSAPRARLAALTCFVGWSPERVATAGEDAWEEVHRKLHRWARVLRQQGVAALAEVVTLGEGLPGRVLAVDDGERQLTDVRHVAQLLHAEATASQLGATALTAWLRRRVADSREETGDEERSRRLESDAEAVQVLTIHRSKGLEFPVVLCPDLWEPSREARDGEPVAFHDDDRRVVDVALAGGAYAAHRRRALEEQRGEDLRLAYVALTRARHQAVVWWAPSWASRDSALGRLVLARERGEAAVPPAGPRLPDDDAVEARFRALAEDADGCVAVEPAVLGAPVHWSPGLGPPEQLVAARFGRRLDRGWRRTSYSDMTAVAHEARVASEPEEPVVGDEPDGGRAPAVPEAAPDPALTAVPSLLGDVPAGVHVGTLVHAVLEATDFAAADLEGELAARVAAAQARRPVEVGDPAVLVRGLRAVLETPLGPLAGGGRLRDVPRADRLDELAFELPLAGGDVPAGRLSPAAIGAVLRAHLPDGDPVRAYADRLEDPALRQGLRGYVTGSIDLVARLPGPRFAVVDYKTNWLGGAEGELTAWHYRPAALAAEMERSHYWLQALLYTAALHRYLRWRQPGYDPDRHLAGVLYLFVRGMSGAATPVVDGTPCGVCAWRPPGALVAALSDVLDAGGA